MPLLEYYNPMSFLGAVQIAGVASAAEASMLEDVGVDFIGFPLRHSSWNTLPS